MKEFSIVDNQRVSSAVELTRKIRNAGFVQYEGDSNKKQQEALQDAEALTRAVAQLFICFISGLPLSEPRNLTDEQLSELRPRYSDYWPYTNARSSVSDSVNSLSWTARSLGNFWKASLDYEYREKNDIPLKIDELLSPRVGVIAPLTTDYITAALHKQFVEQQLGRDCFVLKPAAVHISSDIVVLPQSPDGQQVFNAQDTICVYVDLFCYGDTVRAVDKAVRVAYPQKTVYSTAGRGPK